MVTLAIENVIKAARAIRRGCACEYDHRCGACDAVVTLQALLVAHDAVLVAQVTADELAFAKKLDGLVDYYDEYVDHYNAVDLACQDALHLVDAAAQETIAAAMRVLRVAEAALAQRATGTRAALESAQLHGDAVVAMLITMNGSREIYAAALARRDAALMAEAAASAAEVAQTRDERREATHGFLSLGLEDDRGDTR